MERCRFCYKVLEVGLGENIFNNEQTNPSICKIVELFTNLKITESDPYTKLACFDCFDVLVLFYHYREKILQTNQLIIKNGIDINSNNSNGDSLKNEPCVEPYDDKEFIITHNSPTIQIKSEPVDVSQTVYTSNQHPNISMINDPNKKNNENKNGSNNNQQLHKNNLWIERDNQEVIGLVKDEIKVEETCLKIGNNNFQNHEINENNSYAGLLFNKNDSDQHGSDQSNQLKHESNLKASSLSKSIASNKNQNALKDHSYSNKSVEQNCTICKNKFRVDEDGASSGERSYQCNICVEKFGIKPLYSYHLDKRLFQCNICATVFKCKRTLNQHVKVHTKKRYQYFLCIKKLYQKSSSDTHLSRDLPLECRVCNQRFPNINYLERHLYKHIIA